MRRFLLIPALTCMAQAPLRLPQGLGAILLERHESPILRIELRVPIASSDLPPGRPGLAGLWLRTLLAGPAGRRSPEAFALLLEQNGLRLTTTLDHQGVRFSLAARSRDQELAFGLLADLVTRGSLENGPLETQRQKCFQDTVHRRAEELVLARLQAQGGPESPPTEQALSSFTLQELEAFQARILRPERVRMVIAGDLTPAQARQALLLSFGAWAPGSAPAWIPSQAQSPERTAFLNSPPRLLTILPLPEPPCQPLLDPLLKTALPGLQGSGRPGDPWRMELKAEQGEPQARAALAATLEAARRNPPPERAWVRMKAAVATGHALDALDPEARLAEWLDPAPSPAEIQALSSTALQSAWARALDSAEFQTPHP